VSNVVQLHKTPPPYNLPADWRWMDCIQCKQRWAVLDLYQPHLGPMNPKSYVCPDCLVPTTAKEAVA
jgi:hypothetical protein